MMSIYLKDNIPQSSTRLNVVNEIAQIIIIIIINTVFIRRQYVVYVVDTLAQTSDDN
jgi:hypothetical protein